MLDGRKKNGGARAGAGRKAGLPNSSTLEFRNYVRQYTKEAVDMFVAAMRDEEMDMRFRLEQPETATNDLRTPAKAKPRAEKSAAGETVAMLQPGTPGAQAPPSSPAVRALD